MNYRDQIWYRNLLSLHNLSRAWIQETGSQSEKHQLKRMLSLDLSKYEKILEQIEQDQIPKDQPEQFIEELHPGEFLEKLEQTVWTIQAWTIRNLFKQTPESERSALKSTLARVSFKLGREYTKEHYSQFPEERKNDLKEIYQAFEKNPLSGFPNSKGYLVKRLTTKEAKLEITYCPLNSPFLELLPVAQSLCEFHSNWIKGFIYQLNPSVHVEHELANASNHDHCQLRWKLPSAESPFGASSGSFSH